MAHSSKKHVTPQAKAEDKKDHGKDERTEDRFGKPRDAGGPALQSTTTMKDAFRKTGK